MCCVVSISPTEELSDFWCCGCHGKVNICQVVLFFYSVNYEELYKNLYFLVLSKIYCIRKIQGGNLDIWRISSKFFWVFTVSYSCLCWTFHSICCIHFSSSSGFFFHVATDFPDNSLFHIHFPNFPDILRPVALCSSLIWRIVAIDHFVFHPSSWYVFPLLCSFDKRVRSS